MPNIELIEDDIQMSDNEIEMFVNTNLVQGLCSVCRVCSAKDICIEGQSCAPLEKGEIAHVKNGFVVPWVAVKKMCQVAGDIGIQTSLSVPHQYKGDVKFTVKYRAGVEQYKFVAPWYVKLYSDNRQMSLKVRDILLNLAEIADQNKGRCVYRGEHAIYPSVTSTLARHWKTNSAEALGAIGEKNFTRALEFLRDQQPINFDTSKARENYKFEVMAQVQHMRGATNLVDFSSEIWVALFFACIDATDGYAASVSDEGRIWALETERVYEDLKISDLAQLVDGEPNSRWKRQAGVVAIPDTGTIPPDRLNEVVKIDIEDKNQINEFLKIIGITVSTMYGDLEGYIRYGQDFIPLEALCYIVVECLQTEEYNRAISIAETLTRNENLINQKAGYYLRGLSYAFQGELNQAYNDIGKFPERGDQII